LNTILVIPLAISLLYAHLEHKEKLLAARHRVLTFHIDF